MRVVLFTGKGGVGKTTLAAATAASLARSGRKVLVVSTDPAHSLGDALEVELGGEPVEVEAGLYAAHVDARALLDGAWSRLQGHLGTLLAGAGVDELVADELTVLPGVDDLLALGEVRRLVESGLWEVVVVDCGPTAETLRLLGLPEAFTAYLERLFPAHRRAVRGLLTGLAGAGRDAQPAWDRAVDALDALAEQLRGLRELLADPDTSIRLVLTPERVVVAETRRTLTALALHGLRVDGLVANRVLPEAPASLRGPAGRWLRERHAEQKAVLAELDALPLPLRIAEHTATEPTGLPALRELAGVLYEADDPAAATQDAAPPLLQVRRTAGSGTSPDSAFELVVALPGAARGQLDITRIDDDLAITTGGTRRVLALPSVLRRCTATGAHLDGDDLRVAFVPDPAVWLR
ncbi:ArsA family ATPase [Pseudonocardia sichuanensis]|uniref:Arsenite efflux ATP-binding protein ArsA n=1 Tax=Pseudonocardia kunmingensis TaxID=630975 RepID=A0A543DXS4_9PSEU|nr:TRC40/GET3/ArsA family transport-energizing ATPase [Pseudonocardia kunmingensis]TQM14116.1 arsenite efflux ATP-binding protein ArsA [Pseudonocardia kunmingensis]